MSDHLFDKVSGIKGVNLQSTKTLKQLVRAALESYWISYVILDGLDECTGDEVEKLVQLVLVSRKWRLERH